MNRDPGAPLLNEQLKEAIEMASRLAPGVFNPSLPPTIANDLIVVYATLVAKHAKEHSNLDIEITLIETDNGLTIRFQNNTDGVLLHISGAGKNALLVTTWISDRDVTSEENALVLLVAETDAPYLQENIERYNWGVRRLFMHAEIWEYNRRMAAHLVGS